MTYKAIDDPNAIKTTEIDCLNAPLYLGKGYLECSWNKCLMEWLAEQALLNNTSQKWGLPEVEKSYLVNEFYAQLRTSRNVWFPAHPPPVESPQAKVAKVVTQMEQHAVNNKMNQWKKSVSV